MNKATDQINICITLVNKTGAGEIDPVVSVGIGWDSEHEFRLGPGRNVLRFSEPLHEHGCQYLTVHVVNPNPNVGAFDIVDLILDGRSMTHKLSQGIYYPMYEEGCPKRPPGDYQEVPGCKNIANRGTWRWHFTTPLYTHTFGLDDKYI